MADAVTESDAARPSRRPWRKTVQRLSRRLLPCSCLRAQEKDLLAGGEPGTDGGPQAPCQEEPTWDGELVYITVEDLGLVNHSFSLAGEPDTPTSGGSVAHSAVSASGSQKTQNKKRVKPLSSLPLQTRVDQTSSHDSEDVDDEEEDEEEEDPTLFETDSTPASESLLMPPAIHLIPPSPSDVIDDNQFFDTNSEEESAGLASGSDGSNATGDQESDEERKEVEEGGGKMEDGNVDRHAGSQCMDDGEREPECSAVEPKTGEAREAGEEENEKENMKEKEKEKETEERSKPSFLRSAYQVAPLPEFPRKRSFNTGINLLSFTEHNLDDLSNKDAICHELLKAELHLHPLSAKMETFTHVRKPATRSCSLGETITRSHTFHATTHIDDQTEDEEASPRQRRITVASYVPQSKDQNGNFAEQELDGKGAKPLGEFTTDEVCQWFISVGLQKCLPFIKEANLCGADIASVDINTLDVLHISTLEEREQLLSAIYRELHPPSTTSQKLDSLLETLGPNNVETFTAALVSMSKSKSAPHVSRLNMNRGSITLSKRSHSSLVQKNSQLIEITIHVSERIVHLRTPRETSVGKVMESCIRMLGMTEDKDLFTLKEKQGSLEELSLEIQVGGLAKRSENGQLELHMCKKEKTKTTEIQDLIVDRSQNGLVNQNPQVSSPGREEKMKELNQQVDSLQNVILQVQELHHGLVTFCSELKRMDGEADMSGLSSAELDLRLGEAQGRLRDKRQSLQDLRDNLSRAAVHRNKRSEVRLLDKMTLNCQVFKEEISLVHLKRQVAHLQTALQECQDKGKAQRTSSTLGQMVSPQCPAMLLVVQENRGPDGHYGFVCRLTQGCGLVVIQAEQTHLRLNDRLVEVNGVPVVGYDEEELVSLLLQHPTAQIVVLRRPPPSPASQQQPLPPGHNDNHDIIHSIPVGAETVTTTTPQYHELIAI